MVVGLPKRISASTADRIATSQTPASETTCPGLVDSIVCCAISILGALILCLASISMALRYLSVSAR